MKTTLTVVLLWAASTCVNAAGLGDSPFVFDHEFGGGQVISGGAVYMNQRDVPDLEMEWKINQRSIRATFRANKAISIRYISTEPIEDKEFIVILEWNTTSFNKWRKIKDVWTRTDGSTLQRNSTEITVILKQEEVVNPLSRDSGQIKRLR